MKRAKTGIQRITPPASPPITTVLLNFVKGTKGILYINVKKDLKASV